MENMIETYEIVEAKGKDDQINYVQFRIKFELDGFKAIHGSFTRLPASMPGSSTEEQLIEACLNEMSDELLNTIRQNAYDNIMRDVDYAENSQVFIQKKHVVDSIPRLYARLVLIENDLWDTVKNYFAQPERTEVELAFFEDASEWKRSDPVLQQTTQTVLQLTEQQIDEFFERADELFLENNPEFAQ